MKQVSRIPESFRGWDLIEATFVGLRAVFLYQQRGTDVCLLLEETPEETYVTLFSEAGHTEVLDAEIRMFVNKLRIDAGVHVPEVEIVRGGTEAAYVYSGIQ